MSDRIRCINPACRRTAAADKFPGHDGIICGKCWKALPQGMRARHRQLGRRGRKLDRLNKKAAYQGRETQWWVVNNLYRSHARALDAAINNWFKPGSHQFETPAGIADFMKENGIG